MADIKRWKNFQNTGRVLFLRHLCSCHLNTFYSKVLVICADPRKQWIIWIWIFLSVALSLLQVTELLRNYGLCPPKMHMPTEKYVHNLTESSCNKTVSGCWLGLYWFYLKVPYFAVPSYQTCYLTASKCMSKSYPEVTVQSFQITWLGCYYRSVIRPAAESKPTQALKSGENGPLS